MNEEQRYNLKWKLPDLLYSFIKAGRTDEIRESMDITPERLLKFLKAEEFPSEEELRNFCKHFKMRYSTIKTWNTMNLD